MPNTNATLHEADVRAMLRLLGETVVVEGGHEEKKRHLMRGLCDLVKAVAWFCTLSCDVRPGGSHICAGFSETPFAVNLQMLENRESAGPVFATVQASAALTTMTREEIDPENRTQSHEDALRVLLEAGVGPLMMIALPLDDDSVSSIVLYRRGDAEPFTRREAQIAHVVLSEVPWMHMAGWPEDRGAKVPQLYPQQRVVLRLLLDGMGRKQIADHMAITENTVAGYAKDVYRHFGVHAQPELMRKFLAGKTHAPRRS